MPTSKGPPAVTARSPRAASAREGVPGRGKPTPAVATLVRALACLDLGDQFAREGDRERALSYYGRALNDYLGDRLFTMAATVAQRMIDRYPDVVRARMTLGVLSLAEAARVLPAVGIRSTCSALDDYVTAVQASGQQEIAVRQLRRLADVTESEAVRERVADFLRALGDEDAADEVVRAAPLRGGRSRRSGSMAGDQHTRWVELLLTPHDAA